MAGSAGHRPKQKWLGGVTALAAVLFPLALLFDFHAQFYTDWSNNLWLTAFNGDFLRARGYFPSVLNYHRAVGGTAPLFYGYLLYPLLGTIASVGGAHLALRIGCVVVGLLEFSGLYCAGRNIYRHRGLAATVAISILWSAYGLTNLYNRSALPEYFATGFLAATVGFILASLTAEPGQPQGLWIWLSCVCGTLAMGSHPITTLVGAPVIAGLIVFAVWGHWRGTTARFGTRGWILCIAGAALGLLTLTPWLAMTLHWGHRLGAWGGPSGFMHFPDRCDNLAGRFLPWPHDAIGAANEGKTSTPYLEAPLAMDLVLLLAWLLIGAFRGGVDPATKRIRPEAWMLLIVSLLWLAFLLFITLSPAFGDRFPQFGTLVQFSYRLVSHCNLALALGCLAAGLLARKAIAGRPGQASLAAAICCLIAAATVVIKLEHGAAVQESNRSSAFGLTPNPARLIDGRDALHDIEPMYATPSLVRKLSDAEAAEATLLPFPVVNRGSHYAQVEPMVAVVDRPRWFVTNAAVFPYGEVLRDGQLMPADQLAHRDWALAIHLPAGRSVLSWRWNPPSSFHRLRVAGLAAALALFAGTFVVYLRERRLATR